MITLFGATGYTGTRVARVLERIGLPYRLAGRSTEKLAALSASLPSNPSWLTADASRPATLPALAQGSRVLINCAGPFTDLGERVVALAAMNGVHYIDMTNELGYRYKLRSYDELARSNNCAVAPACGFEVALSDCAAALLGAQSPEPVTDLHVVYAIRGSGASRGTLQSAVRSLGTSWIAYRDGAWRGSLPAGRTRRFILPGQSSPLTVVEFPSCEAVTVPASVNARSVRVWMDLGPAARWWAPLLIAPAARLARSRYLGPHMARIASSRGLNAEANGPKGEFQVYVTADRAAKNGAATGPAWMLLSGRDVYGLTGEIAGYVAAAMMAPGYRRAGVLGPAQAVDPGEFIWWLRTSQGVRVSQSPG